MTHPRTVYVAKLITDARGVASLDFTNGTEDAIDVDLVTEDLGDGRVRLTLTVHFIAAGEVVPHGRGQVGVRLPDERG